MPEGSPGILGAVSLTRFDTEAAEFATMDQAQEAYWCVTADKETLADVAARANSSWSQTGQNSCSPAR